MRMQRKITVYKLGEEDKANIQYWREQPINKRYEQLEINRRNAYGDAASGRLQRSLEVVKLT